MSTDWRSRPSLTTPKGRGFLLPTKGFTEAHAKIDGEDVGRIGVRPKGGKGTLGGCFDESGQLICAKLSYKLKFSEYEKAKTFRGLKRLNLHSAVKDASLLHEYLGYGLFGRMGVAASRVTHAELFVNGKLFGLYVVVEEVDKRFLKSRFPRSDEGILCKAMWPAPGSLAVGLARLQAEDPEASQDDLMRLSEELRSSTDTELPGVLSKWSDVDELNRFLAVDDAIIHWDGPTRFHVASDGSYSNYNFYFYLEEKNDRFHLIPWDLDHTFEQRGWIYCPSRSTWNDLSVDCAQSNTLVGCDSDRVYLVPTCDSILRGLALQDPAGYHEAVQRLLEGPFVVAELYEMIDARACLLAPAVERDESLSESKWHSALAQLKLNIELLRERIEEGQ